MKLTISATGCIQHLQRSRWCPPLFPHWRRQQNPLRSLHTSVIPLPSVFRSEIPFPTRSSHLEISIQRQLPWGQTISLDETISWLWQCVDVESSRIVRLRGPGIRSYKGRYLFAKCHGKFREGPGWRVDEIWVAALWCKRWVLFPIFTTRFGGINPRLIGFIIAPTLVKLFGEKSTEVTFEDPALYDTFCKYIT